MGDESRVAGLLLAAGAGQRMGTPKALVRTPSGEAWVVRGARVLLDSGCSPVVVVVGAGGAEAARRLTAEFGDEPRLVVHSADQWSDGMSASLGAGLDALSSRGLDGAIITLVDTPSLLTATVARIRSAAAAADGRLENALAQATFGARPGHPVFIGSAHWSELRTQLAGDSGARVYLAEHDALRVDCSDLEHGADADTPDDITP